MASKIVEGRAQCKSATAINSVYHRQFWRVRQYFDKNRFPIVPVLFYRKGQVNKWVNAMTGLVRTSADLDPRRRRILYRCWHRGIREMDLVLGQFAEENIADLSDEQLDELEIIMNEEDQDLVQMVTGAQAIPEKFQTPLFETIISYRPDFDLVTAQNGHSPK